MVEPRPSQIYPRYTKKQIQANLDYLRELGLRYRVIDFRPLRTGDEFLDPTYLDVSTCRDGVQWSKHWRLIVEKEK